MGGTMRRLTAFAAVAAGFALAYAGAARSGDIITGAGAGGGPHVEQFDGTTLALKKSFYAYDPAFGGGVQVASGDVNGDGTPDLVTGAGPGGGPHVEVFDGVTGAVIRSFYAYNPAFGGGVRVAGGDVNGDGTPDIITGAGPGGGPHVQAFDGKSGVVIRSFYAYNAAFGGGVRVAGGDVNGDGTPDILTGAGPGGGPHVEAFDGRTNALVQSFYAYNSAFTGGVFVGSWLNRPAPVRTMEINPDAKTAIATDASTAITPETFGNGLAAKVGGAAAANAWIWHLQLGAGETLQRLADGSVAVVAPSDPVEDDGTGGDLATADDGSSFTPSSTLDPDTLA